MSCQSQDNLSVQKQILKSVHFLVGAPAPSSPPYATKTQYENVLPYSIVSECAQYMYRVSTMPHVFTPQLHSPDSLLSQPPEKQDIFLSIKDLCLLFWRSRAGVHGLLGPTSRLKEIEKHMKQRNLLQSFKGYSYSYLLREVIKKKKTVMKRSG